MRVLAPKSPELMLETKDWRILQELLSNIRQPLSKVAKHILLSRQSVEYRLAQLQQSNLITGSRTVIDVRKLGYQSYHVFLEMHAPLQEKELLERALNAPFVNALIIYSGKYNIELSLQCRSEEEFLSSYQQLTSHLDVRNEVILTLLATLRSEVLPFGYFPNLKGFKLSYGLDKISKPSLPLSLDSTDVSILHLLADDAQISKSSLAQKLKISKDTVSYRLQKLERHGYILQYRPALNYAVLGLSINSILFKVNSLPSQIGQFEGFLQSHGKVLWVTKTFGYYNYLAYVITRDLEEFHEVINEVKEKFENLIKTYEILFAYKELKYSFMAKSVKLR